LKRKRLHKKCWLYACLFILVFTGLHAYGQLPEYALSRITEQEGLSTAEVVAMAEDGSGYLWIATQSKVQRFDGRHTIHHSFSETVYHVLVDWKNRVWVTTSQYIYLFETHTRQFARINVPFLENESPLRLYQRNNIIGLIGSQRRYELNEQRKTFNPSGILPHKNDTAVLRLFAQSPDTDFFSTNKGIGHLDETGHLKTFTPILALQTLIGSQHGGIFISSYFYKSYWLSQSDGKLTPLAHPYPGGGKEMLLYGGVPFDKDTYLLSSNLGLLFFDLRSKQLKQPVFFFQGELFRNPAAAKYIFRTADSTIYICHSDGIYFFKPKQQSVQYLRNYRYGTQQLPNNDVRGFTEDGEGWLWMATAGGIARLNPVSGALQTFANAMGSDPIAFPSYRYVHYHKGNIWIGTSGNGVWLLHQSTGRYIRPRYSPDSLGNATRIQMESAYIWKIQPLADGRFLVVCSRKCFVIDPDTLLCTQVHFASSAESSRSAWQDHTGRIWHGTANGLTVMNDSFKLYFHIRDSFPDKRIACITEWKPNHMLAGSKGLYEIILDEKNHRMVSFSRIEAIPAIRFVYCMQADKEGLIWLGTDEGIYAYDPKNKTAELYDISEGVQPQPFSSNGAFLHSNGTMYMGGHNGINYFNPLSMGKTKPGLYPEVTSFMVQGQALPVPDLQQPVTLSYNQRNISFNISVPFFKNPFSLQYRYRLKDNDSVWIDNGYLDRVRINNLSPGRYRLQVSVSTDGLSWSTGGHAVNFAVQKPWWQTHAFIATVVALLFSAAFAIHRVRKRNRDRLEMQKAVDYFARKGQPYTDSVSILWDIIRKSISRLGFEDCVIYLLDEERNVLVQKAAYGDKNPDGFLIANPIEIPVGQGITGYAAQQAKSIQVNDTTKDPRYIIDDAMRLSELAVPIVHDGKVIGVIDSEHSKRGFFKPVHRKTLEQIASICASKIAGTLALEQRLKAEQRLKEIDISLKESRFMNLRLQMNPHFLFNTLTSIQYLVVSGQTQKAIQYLNIFSGFLRSLLQFAESTLISLEEELKILRQYIELESLSVDETFIFQISTEETLDPEDVLVPFMVLQPFVENAIHHGLIHRVGDKRIEITIRNFKEAFLLCTIEDNGVGRQKAAEIKARKMRAARHESKGVEIVQQRLELLNEKTGKPSKVEYEDLYDDNGGPAGTRVTLWIPFYQNDSL
jgi:ligand-binding sensor domain-containing protein/putative methionine-R-sulfoxide reductase with GAF domain